MKHTKVPRTTIANRFAAIQSGDDPLIEIGKSEIVFTATLWTNALITAIVPFFAIAYAFTMQLEPKDILWLIAATGLAIYVLSKQTGFYNTVVLNLDTAVVTITPRISMTKKSKTVSLKNIKYLSLTREPPYLAMPRYIIILHIDDFKTIKLISAGKIEIAQELKHKISMLL